MRRFVPFLANLILILVIAVVTLGVVEIAMRIGLFGGSSDVPQETGTDSESIYRLDSEGLFTLRPNLTRQWGSPEFSEAFSTDSLGFRISEPPDSGLSDTVGTRILVLGDSFVFGWGVGDDETLPAQLQAVLNAGVDYPLHVINLGIPAYSPGRSAALLEKQGLALDPDVVLLVVTESNDVMDDLKFARDPLDPPSDMLTGFWAKSRLVQLLHWKLGSLSRWVRMSQTKNVDRTIGYLDEIARICSREPVPLIVALFPSRAQMEPWGPSAWVLEQLEVDSKIHDRILNHVEIHPDVEAVLDLRRFLSDAGGGDEPVFYPIDGHPTPHAYRTCARALAPVVLESLERTR